MPLRFVAARQVSPSIHRPAGRGWILKHELEDWGKHPIALSIFRVYSIVLRY